MKLKYYMTCVPALFVLLQGQGLLPARAEERAGETCAGRADRDALALLISDHEAMPEVDSPELHDAALLKDIILSSCYPSFTRGRAMRILGLLKGEASAPFLEAVIDDGSKSFYLRIEAAHVLKNILELTEPDDLARSLGPLLGSSDARLRATALGILTSLDSPVAMSMIQDHGIVERHGEILHAFYRNDTY